MSTKLQNLPVYQNVSEEVDVELYRNVRLLLSRRGGHPVHIDLPGLRDLRLVLERDAWICVDTLLDDLPVMAWTHFDKGAVFGDAEGIRCSLIYYHSQAAVIIDSILHSLRREMKYLSSPQVCYIDNIIDMHLAR